MAFQPTATTHEREARSRGEAFAVATVVRAERPTSCLPGDKAVIRSDGRLQGWIGGSCAQPTVISEALASLEDGEPRLVLLTPDGVAVPRTGMTVHQMSCFSGGVVEVFIEPFLPAPQLIICGVSPAALRSRRLDTLLGSRSSSWTLWRRRRTFQLRRSWSTESTHRRIPRPGNAMESSRPMDCGTRRLYVRSSR